MTFIFVYSTLPSVEMNHFLNLVKKQRFKEINALKGEEKRMIRLSEALDRDPITVEKFLRDRFGTARRKGELEIDYKAQ